MMESMDQEHDRPNGQDSDAPAPVPGDEAPAPTAANALAASQAEAVALKDQLLRALAETENVRRRAQRDREEAGKYVIAAFARELVGVADNLRRAIAAIPPEALANDEALKNLAAGVELTERQLLTAFERFQLRKVEPLGEKFDSNLHQAMFELPAQGQPPGTVLQVLQPGYVLHDRLIRPAMVAVAKAEAGDPGAVAAAAK
jgi:molecular chaperone GrpE